MTTLPSDERLRELAAYADAHVERCRKRIAAYGHCNDELSKRLKADAEETIAYQECVSAVLQAVIAARVLCDQNKLLNSRFAKQMRAILADAPARARRG